MGEIDKQDSDRSFTQNWKGIVYLAFGRNGISPSELNQLEWDIYFEMLDEFERENKEYKKEKAKIDKASKGVISPPKLQGETEKEKILSMANPKIVTKR